MAFKLRELSDMFCALDGIDDRDKRNHHYSQMRLLAQRELIKPTTSDISRGKVARYSFENACVARILMTLHRSGGFDAPVIRAAADTMTKPYHSSTPKAGRIKVHSEVSRAIDEIRQGKKVTFEVTLRQLRETGERHNTGGFLLEGEQSEVVKKLLDAWGPVLMTVTIDASKLLQPLITELDHSEGNDD